MTHYTKWHKLFKDFPLQGKTQPFKTMGQNPQHITIESLLLVTALSSMPCEQDLPTQCVCKSKLNFLFEETRVVNQGKSKQGKNANRSRRRGNKNHTCMAIYYRCKDSSYKMSLCLFSSIAFWWHKKGFGFDNLLLAIPNISLWSQSHWTCLGLLKSILVSNYNMFV